MIKASLALIRNYETTFIQLKYEDLLHFVINDLLKSGFFHNKNFGLKVVHIMKKVPVQVATGVGF